MPSVGGEIAERAFPLREGGVGREERGDNFLPRLSKKGVVVFWFMWRKFPARDRSLVEKNTRGSGKAFQTPKKEAAGRAVVSGKRSFHQSGGKSREFVLSSGGGEVTGGVRRRPLKREGRGNFGRD